MEDQNDSLPIVPLMIGGKATAANPPLRFPIYSYEQQKNVGLAESADVATAKLAADTAAEAFKTWKKVSAVKRRELLLKYSALLRAHKEDLSVAQAAETSAPKLWCYKNVDLACSLIEETAACITSLKGDIVQTESTDALALALTVPIGPVLVMAPWNSPIILGARNIATAVAAGCSVVFKASELCPRTHHLLVKIFAEAGLPDGVVNVIQTVREMASEVTEAIIAHPAIRKVEFVGSASVGKLVGQVCAKYLKPIFMELGGKGPSIVLDDADLPAAAKKCVLGAFLHHGQLCFSTERIIVLESVAAEFKNLLVSEVKAFQPTSGVSPRIVEASAEKIADAESKGATFLVGGTGFSSPSTLKPSIVLGVTKDMTLYDEEAFGPSASLFIARDEEHAIEIANDTAYGLSSAVHTTNLHRGLAIAKELVAGQVHINNMTAHDEPTLPLGGVKGSGWGRNNAIYGLQQFCETKTVTWALNGLDFV